MARKQKKIHYLYKTTCVVTGRWYIGMHSTHTLDDGYLGSGKRLRYSIRKYGEENHVKEILEFFENRELLVEAEIKAITDDMIKDPMCMNLTEGGSGGHGARFLSKEQLKKGREEADKKLREKYGDNFRAIIAKNYHDNLTEEEKVKRSDKIKLRLQEVGFNHNTFQGKTHSEETKKKISESNKGQGKGSANSQFGTCWITNGEEVKKIKKENLESYLDKGWRKGRK